MIDMDLRAGSAIVLFAALSLAGCDKKQDLPPPIRPVLSLVVAPTIAPATRLTGSVEPRYQAQLGFQMTGRMISRDVNVGDRVSKGQQLATLDPTVPRLAVVSAQADFANARAVLANAAATFGRQQELIKTGSASQAQLDSATAARDSAQARVNQVTAALQKAQEQLGYTVLKSDYDGVVASWSAEVGQVVAQSQTAVTIARPDPRDAVFDVPDERVALFARDARFQVSLLVNPDIAGWATVREIAPQSDAATRTRRIRLTLDDPPESFRLGTTVQIAVSAGQKPRIELPAGAILEQDGKTSVWIAADGHAQLHSVTLGDRDPDRVTVTSGLETGDRVIVAGVHSLSEGQPIKLTEQ
ncbi:efflux RND transporter periplasmic adaptor subunit [Lichenifustis flavocetrariae]|uniref:Efflux RND transporter periplasmic adaptor subunit n=1 Tax=Lichenifustis flavocetrariae TaxID=2949735 RepID=A0AA41YVR8_9HYPH|nr:efflux RND transporter periplasmic adaptor subunit [Lichenifustis flavocetrariae]MCW6509471.1 efflux RND transporter periplasmic adaptor subunit [Lichenifustis flavocetrariae]